MNDFFFADLPNHEVTSLINLVTTGLLLAVVWIILIPIMSGEVVLVSNRRQELDQTNFVEDASRNIENLSDSASNLFNWWAGNDQHNSDSYQTGYDNQNYDPYYGYDWASYYNDPYTNQETTSSPQVARQFQFSVGGLGSGLETFQNALGKASRALERFDVVDSAFNVLNIDTDDCRKRAICQLERSIADSTFLSFMFEKIK